MVVMARAEVTYACYLDEEQSKMVVEYAKEHNKTLEEAVEELYFDNDTNFELYKVSHESDFSTESIDSVEFDEDEEELEEYYENED